TLRADAADIGRQVSLRMFESADRMVALAHNRDGVLHLHYNQLVANPMAAVDLLYRHCGLRLSLEAELRMRSWLTTQGEHRRGRYSLDEFGLDSGRLRERFAHYVRTFDVATDWPVSRARAA